MLDVKGRVEGNLVEVIQDYIYWRLAELALIDNRNRIIECMTVAAPDNVDSVYPFFNGESSVMAAGYQRYFVASLDQSGP